MIELKHPHEAISIKSKPVKKILKIRIKLKYFLAAIKLYVIQETSFESFQTIIALYFEKYLEA